MKINRLFTAHLAADARSAGSLYGDLRFVERVSALHGQSITVIAPEHWSQVAVDILAQKYLRRTGVPSRTVTVAETGVPMWLCRSVPAADATFGAETDARQVFHRLSGTWTYWGWKYGYFDTESDARAFYDEIAYMLAAQICAPNSPQWFNTGLHWAYGITGPAQGHYYVSPDDGTLKRSEDAYSHPQPHACFILSIEDDLVNPNGIMDTWLREARIFKYGSGVGSNFSKLRAADEPLSGGGRSSGVMSFLRVGDRAAGAIKSGGTTRRAAKMVILDIDHPDIAEFIQWKVQEEHKVGCLVTGAKIYRRHLSRIADACFSTQPPGFDPKRNPALRRAIRQAVSDEVPLSVIRQALQQLAQGVPLQDLLMPEFTVDWEGEAYQTVSGQNSNNSVRIPHAFMRAVQRDEMWSLYWRTELVRAEKEKREPRPCKAVPARHLWESIVRAAWRCADPGLLFHDTINEWHTCSQDEPIYACNPCGEYHFINDTACDLASLNLVAFYDQEHGLIRTRDLQHAVRLWTFVLDISVLMAQFPSPEIATRSHAYRTLGLGYANLGSLLMRMGLPYDSDKGRQVAAALMAIVHCTAYAASAEMARDIAPFPAYARNRESMMRVIRNHHRAVFGAPAEAYEGLSHPPQGLNPALCPADLLEVARSAADAMLRLGESYGFRNAQVTVIAPTGTIGLLMDCDTTGIEPDFALVKFKKLAGGGYFKIINQAVPHALRRLGYSQQQIADICQYAQGNPTLNGCPHINPPSLKALGFTDVELQRVEQALPSAWDISAVFTPAVLGEAFCRQTLGISPEQLQDYRFNLLTHLGFSDKQIAEANHYVCGAMTLEGAPHLQETHLPVFDCATTCGKHGKRFIRPQAHIEMMAAVQPFVSGAISKTVNLPHHASLHDVDAVYRLAYERGLKAIALYRDGSKLSQPLSGSADDWSLDDLRDDTAAEQNAQATPVETLPQSMLGNGQVQRAFTALANACCRSSQRRMPNRRRGYTQKVKINGKSIFLRTGEYPDGTLGEIFIDMHKEGASFRSLLNCFAIAISLGLQYGVPLEEFVESFTFTRFEPNGPVVGHDRIRNATSIIDYIFRELAITYLDRQDLAHVKPSPDTTQPQHDHNGDAHGTPPSATTALPALSDAKPIVVPYVTNGHVVNNGRADLAAVRTPAAHYHNTPSQSVAERRPSAVAEGYERQVMQARTLGYTGDVCPECGSFTMVRNGTCLKCDTCGTTTGCS